MSLGADVPPFILQAILPQRLFLAPTAMTGGLLHLAAALNSGSLYSESMRSPRVLGSFSPKKSVR